MASVASTVAFIIADVMMTSQYSVVCVFVAAAGKSENDNTLPIESV